MNTYKIEQATPDTLNDIYALHDPAEAAQRLPALIQRMAEGKTSADRFWLLRSPRGVEAVVNLTPLASIPLFPRYRADTPPEQVTEFLRHLKALVADQPEQQLVLDSQFVQLDAAPVEAAGWVMDDALVVYETDLRNVSLPLSPDALEGGSELLERPDVQALLHELGQSDWEWHPDWVVVGLPDATGKAVALGAFGPSSRPRWGNLNMIGLQRSVRGQGYGTRLHAHLLARAAERFEWHGGGTEAENHAMRRIFEKNGSVLISTQIYFR